MERYAPNRRWHVDTIIKVLTLAGNHVKDESINSLIHIISATTELQSYCVYKLFFSLRENLNQDGLAKVALWCIGEFATLILSGKTTGPDNTPIAVSQEEVIDLVDKVLARHNVSEQVREYALTTLIKLYTKFTQNKDKIRELIDSQTTSPSLEVQQRACEYLHLLDQDFDSVRPAIVDVIPALEVESMQRPVGDAQTYEVPSHANKGQEEKKSSHVGGLLDDDLLGGGPVQTNHTTAPSTQSGSSNLNILDDIFSGNAGGPKPAAPSNIGTNVTNKRFLLLYV